MAIFRNVAARSVAWLPLVFSIFIAGPALAQDDVVPKRRAMITQNMDFYGSDLQPVFDTTFDTCQSSCLADNQCKAFTFNFKSAACFPKTDVSEMTPYDGAASAQIFETDKKVLALQPSRLDSLAFLPGYYFDEARDLSKNLGRRYVTNQWSEAELMAASREARASGDLLSAFKFAGAAISRNDTPALWVEMAQLALEVPPKNNQERRRYREISSSAAINGYLRAMSPAVQANALNTLAKVLELRGQGRETIPALRLSQSLAPRLDTEDAIARAISLFGFRVVEHQVDSNAAAPRICVNFSEKLVSAGVDYSDYVRTPQAGLVVEVKGKQLCLEGVIHGERYRFTVRAGLPADSGEKLSKSVDLNVYVRDREPLARFVGRAYVLPRGEKASIPIVTVNLEEVDLKIHRVGERNILRAIQQRVFSNPLSVYDENDLANSLGEEVWSGIGEVGLELNRDVTTTLPVGEAIAQFEPGVYAMRARVPGADVYDKSAATQWFIVTDLGLASMSGSNGLHVFVRSLATAEAKAGATVQLVATNNIVLGEALTDANGYASFAAGLTRGTGGATPALLTVSDNGSDFAFLNLKEAAFDLSDRGVEGRPSPPPIDVFLTTDRGAYRTGEMVYATVLARDEHADAIENLPLTAIVTRPDGVEFTRALLEDDGAGGRVYAVQLPNGAQRGTWRLKVHADANATALTTTSFLVEDFVPERIDFDLALADDMIHVDDVPTLTIDARYLYGAPGANLAIEGDVRISSTNQMAAYPGYQFGRHDEGFFARTEYFGGNLATGADGKAYVGLPIANFGETSRLLKMRTTVRLREGSGRPVERMIEATLAPDASKIGIKPLFDGTLAEDAAARFEVIAVGADAQRTEMKRVAWTLNRVQTRYQWYELYGNWNYEPVTTRERIASGEVSLKVDDPTRIEAPVAWGNYELKLENLDGAYASASTQFYAGWYAAADSGNTPDTLEVGLNKAVYQIGDTAQLRVVPRYAGKALVTVVSNRLIDMKTVDVVEGENLIDLTVTEEWGAGAYVSATVIRPMSVAAGHNPSRALGLNWATVDPGSHRLSVAFQTGDEAAPREMMNASLQVSGATAGETVYATIAAVDVGILNLTAFDAPDPDGHYFGQRKLGMALRDVYGRLIDGLQGTPGQVRSGGDAAAAERMQSPPPTEELVSFFSGPLVADANGYVNANFNLPEFNGTIRLMAVVWSKSGVGQASKDVLVRDPVVLTTSLPRFLAPYDESRILVEVAHATGPAGRVGIDVSATNGLYIDQSVIPSSIVLAQLGRATLSIPIAAPAFGNPSITVSITTPDGRQLDKTIQLPVRANDPEIARTNRIELADGDTFTLDANVFAGLQDGTGRATLAVGPIARFDAPGLLSALDSYPYGCTEQITSKALPLLYFEQVATSMGLSEKQNVRVRIEQAIGEVLSNQSSNGAFGLWRPGSGDLWLDAYVSDFLSRANAKGFEVPGQAFRIAMDNLRNRINYAQDFESGGQGIAYALMVLAREGAAAIGDLRYYADAKADAFASPLALAQLGAALAYYGDQIRADAMFRKAGQWLEKDKNAVENQVWRMDYGTNLRDTAAVLALAVEAGSEAVDQQSLARRITPSQTVNRFRSTQENMWSLLAANALIEDTPADAFTVNGVPTNGPLVRVLDAQTGANRSLEIRNNSGKSATTMLTTFGVPTESEPAGGNGYTIERLYFSTDGASVLPEKIGLNERLVVVLRVTPHRYSEARLIINDPLPAGFEIDNPNLLRAGDIKAFEWLKLNASPETAEFRSERFLAAVDWSSKDAFQLAYIVRAISPGKFHHPAASVEDMYRPAYRARTATGTVEIAAK